MNSSITSSNYKSVEILLRNLQRIHADIQFADRKAALLLLPNTGMLALLWPAWQPTHPLPLTIVTFIAMAILVVALSLALCVVVPRGRFYNHRRKHGIADSARIACYRATEHPEFKKAIQEATEATMIEELQDLTFDYSQIHWWKYRFVEASVLATILSFGVTLLVLLWHRLN